VGVWQGFWSLKGRVATERFLFLDDGHWGWLDATDESEAMTARPVQRSGRWDIEEGVVVLAELQRKEIVGCEHGSSSGPPCDDSLDCERCGRAYRIVRHNTPIVERLIIGECPENEEAKALDREYTCSTIGGRVFWRKAVPAKSEQERFINGE
jgi:hypothetical protein